MQFPDPRYAPHDIIAIGGDLEPQTLLEAYSKGIFPWPIEDYALCWFSPNRRAVLFFDSLHVSRSLLKARSRTTLEFTIDQDFEQVVRLCASAPRPEQHGTWILPEIEEAYLALHEAGHAHSVEAWEAGRLVGGLYGVDAGGAFSGESMFHLRPDASKLALLFLIGHLRSRGLEWLDVQIMTPHMRQLGTRLISRSSYIDLLEATRELGLVLFGSPE
ncbi:MAG: leucyl/phenylalanyl-tRNA--protein transferase [Acidobacteria bacterium]|nr:leucyl/phenylalanyl-tRNA--protein transferase [Acidobacteriota bacterium]